MLNIKNNIREYISNSDLGSNTKKIENRFYPRFVFLLQIMLVGLLHSSHTDLLGVWRSDLDSLYFRAEFKDQTNTFHICRSVGLAFHFTTWPGWTTQEFWEKWSPRTPEKCQNSWSIPVMVMTVTPNTAQHEECDIIDCVGILIVGNVGIQLHAGHPLLSFSNPSFLFHHFLDWQNEVRYEEKQIFNIPLLSYSARHFPTVFWWKQSISVGGPLEPRQCHDIDMYQDWPRSEINKSDRYCLTPVSRHPYYAC